MPPTPVLGGVVETAEVIYQDDKICAGFYGDRSSCSLQADALYVAERDEVCTAVSIPHVGPCVPLTVTARASIVTLHQWNTWHPPCLVWGEDPDTQFLRSAFFRRPWQPQ